MKKAFTFAVLLFSTLALAATVFAARPQIIPSGSGELAIPSATVTSGTQDAFIAGQLLPTITRTVIALAGACSVLFIIIGGITILTAYGKTDKIESAKKTIIYAIIGLLVSILSYAIVSIISSIQLPS